MLAMAKTPDLRRIGGWRRSLCRQQAVPASVPPAPSRDIGVGEPCAARGSRGRAARSYWPAGGRANWDHVAVPDLGDVGTPLPSATPSPAPDHRNLRPYALLSLTFRAPDAPACMPGAVSSSPPSQ